MSELPDLFGKQAIPRTAEDWQHLGYRAADIFSPHAPIDEEQLFAGRFDLIDGLLETILQRGQHGIVYGERGVGKTSLANILKDKILVKSQRFTVVKRACTAAHTYRTIWEQLLDQLRGADDTHALGDEIDHQVGPYQLVQLLRRLPAQLHPVFVIDEYDRVSDQATHVRMADTIKYFSDESMRATLIIIGVARNVRNLFGGHPSIERNVRQLHVPEMKYSELQQIISKRLTDLQMTIESGVEETLIRLAQGFPGYVHLLGQNCARTAIARQSLQLTTADLNSALIRSIEACDEKIKDLYARSVRSTKPGNQYREALLACALAPIDERGYFSAASVRNPFSRIMNRSLDIPHFARHLNEFCKEERGPALMKEGKPKSFEFRFTDALLRPFVVIKGMSDGLLGNVKLNTSS